MKSNLLIAAGLLSAVSMTAETKVYTTEALGIVGGVSDNGRYAAIFDDENNLGYIWDSENPDQFRLIDGVPSKQVLMYDVTDNGMGVGAYYQKGGRFIPCYVEDGVVKDLPLDPNSLNTNEARAVSKDGKFIAGYQYFNDPDPNIPGKYIPCLWTRNESGEYDLTLYSDQDYPAHQGFYTSAVSNDGRVIAGRLYCAAGSEIPAIIKDGELIYWNNLETLIEPFIYKGEVIGEYKEYYIDGYHDGFDGEYFTGDFQYIDDAGNIYGSRTKCFGSDGEIYTGEPNYENEGLSLKRYASIYNYNTDEWFDVPSQSQYLCGIDGKLAFMGGDSMAFFEGENIRMARPTDEFNFTSPSTITGIMRISADGKVLGGTRQELNPATGEYQFMPLMIVLNRPIVTPGSAIEAVETAPDTFIILSAGRIDIVGGEGIVYDLNGSIIGSGSTFDVAPGIYVVRSGDNVRKVMVK